MNRIVNAKTYIENVEKGYFVEQRALPNTLVPSTDNFIGREEYLTPLLEDYKNGARCFVLHGIGGIGKTEIAKRFIEEIEGEYEAKVFIDMLGMSETPYSAEKAMFEVVRQFKPEIAADISYDHLKNHFRQFVQQQSTLIFLDNAQNKSVVEELKQVRVCLIVTSREVFTLTDKDGAKHIEIMSKLDARNLLYKIAGTERFADGEADKLGQLTGYLPMALRPLAALLAEDEFETAGNLIAQFQNKRKLLKAKVPDYYDRTIATSFDLSYEKLPEEMQRHWRRLSVFPSDFDEAAIAAVLKISKEEVSKTQKQLRHYNLLEGNVKTHRFSLHDLVREYTHTKLKDDENYQIKFHFAAHYASILRRARQMQEDREESYFTKALELIDMEWVNIQVGQKWAAEFLEEDSLMAELCTEYTGYAQYFLTLRLHSRIVINWLEFGLKANRKLKDRLGEGFTLGNLGNAYHRLGEYLKAIDYYEQSLKISREIGDRSGEGVSLGNLGSAFRQLGESQKAISYHKKALIISRETGDRQSEGNCLGNLGNAYRTLGESRTAIECYEQSLLIKHEIGDRRGEGISLCGLGNAYFSLGEYEKSINYYEESLTILREINDGLGEGVSIGNLGDAYYRLGERKKACELWKQSWNILEAIESPMADVFQQNIEKFC